MRRSFLKILIFVVPWLLWLLGAALFATELGSYQKTWDLLHWFFDKIEPGFYYKDPQIISMYQVTQALRKLAHVVVYGGIAVLTIRLFQAGRPRLRLLPLVMALVIPSLFLAIEIYIRLHQSEGTRHVRLEQFILDGIGVASVMLGTLVYFGIKALERWLLAEATKVDQRDQAKLNGSDERGKGPSA